MITKYIMISLYTFPLFMHAMTVENIAAALNHAIEQGIADNHTHWHIIKQLHLMQ
ncbi:MAG: hypothetical protein WA432_04090 [Candidatus Babeliaceae bacterium]